MNREIRAWTTDTGTWRFRADGEAAFEGSDGRGISLPRISCRVVLSHADDAESGCSVRPSRGFFCFFFG